MELAQPQGPALTRREPCCLLDTFTKPGSMQEASLPDAGLGAAVRISGMKPGRHLLQFLVWAPIRPHVAFTTLYYRQVCVCVFPADFVSCIFNSQLQISAPNGTW